jgi:ankyrin repeat protein
VSGPSPSSSHSLPEKPDLHHLKNQARDLLKAGGAVSLSDAQLRVARDYGFASWPKLKAHVESLQEIGQLKAAILGNDLPRVRSLMTGNPALHRAPLGYNGNGPLTLAAECRGAPPTPKRLAIARWMIENGSDIHQGGDGPLMRAALGDERIPMLELLVEHGANVNAFWDGRYPIICAPCETLQPRALEWLIEHGADPNISSPDFGNCVQMLVCTYCRNPAGKHACLEVFAKAGFRFPDTAPMAIHRGRVDLLRACAERDPAIMWRQFSDAEIYPAELDIKPRDGLHCAPLDGGTLLHMAAEYHELEIAEWLIDHGADVNARAAVDTEGFGGHAPRFHTTVTLVIKTEAMARLLLRSGANPNLRATFRKGLRWEGDSEKEQVREFHDVTPIGFAMHFQEPAWINEAAVAAIGEHGGH